MELSGYAILMQELDGGGTWEQLRDYWERDRNTLGERLSQGLVAALDFLDDVFMPTAGDIARHSRSRRLQQLLEERGISSPEAGYGPIRQRRERIRASSGGSRVVAAFAGTSMGVSYDLADLFVVIYVRPVLPEGASLPRSAQLLAAEIDEPVIGGTMRDPHRNLVSTRKSKHYFIDLIDQDDAQLRTYVADHTHKWAGSLGFMINEDAHQLLPHRDDGYTVRISPDDPRTQDLVTNSLAPGFGSGGRLEDRLRHCVEQLAQQMLAGGAVFEIDYLTDRSADNRVGGGRSNRAGRFNREASS